jgi:predicted negative regulator of RcsB-dependent stress response
MAKKDKTPEALLAAATAAQAKAPDELQKLGETAVPWLEKNSKLVMLGVGAFLAVGLGVALMSSAGVSAERSASTEFGKALSVLDREVNATGVAKPGEDAPFKTEAEKDEAIVKALETFRATNTGKKAAASAALPLAQALLRQQKSEAALPLLAEYLKSADPSDPLRPAAFEAQGYALESQKKYDEATAAFEQLAKENKTDFMKGMGQYHLARMLLLKGDKMGAAKLFTELQTGSADTAAARMAKERVAMLAQEGVIVPAAAVPPVVPAVKAP